MDIYRFINSKDIRRYLRDMNYSFTLPEAAFLVYQCEKATLDEKIEAWNELIQTMPDCSMEERDDMIAIDSFHDFLHEYIELQKRIVRAFYENENSVFSYEYHRSGFSCSPDYDYTDYGWESARELFADFDTCMQDYDRNVQCDDVDAIRVRKRPIYHDIENVQMKDEVWLAMNAEKAVLAPPYLRYMYTDFSVCQTDHECKVLSAFDGMWFSFPTPFKRGDIVRFPNRHHEKAYVLKCMLHWTAQELLENGFQEDSSYVKYAARSIERKKKLGSSFDMAAEGYCVETYGDMFFWDHLSYYMDLEYVTEPLHGKERLLYGLSDYLKGKIDVTLLMSAHHVIRLEEDYKLRQNACSVRWHEILGGGFPDVLKGGSKMRIWLDDLRPAPDGYIWCKSVNEAKSIINGAEELIELIDCDHDLGDFAQYGGDGIKLLDWLVETGRLYPVRLHTMNPVGRENMQRTIDRYWNKQ